MTKLRYFSSIEDAMNAKPPKHETIEYKGIIQEIRYIVKHIDLDIEYLMGYENKSFLYYSYI